MFVDDKASTMRLPAHDVRQAVLFQFLQHVVQFDWKVAIRGVVSFRFTSPVIRQATPVLVAVHNLSWVWLVDVVTRHGGTAKERFDSLQQEENKSEASVAFVTLELLVLTSCWSFLTSALRVRTTRMCFSIPSRRRGFGELNRKGPMKSWQSGDI